MIITYSFSFGNYFGSITAMRLGGFLKIIFPHFPTTPVRLDFLNEESIGTIGNKVLTLPK